MDRVLAIVPARGGSKGIARKNLALLCGRPLIAYTIDAARASQTVSRTIVSTDDHEIAEAAEREGAEVPFVRPAALASDSAPMMDVARHAFSAICEAGDNADVIVILQPTSPLRRGGHIDAAVRLLRSTGADTVVTVVKVPHHFGPSSLMQIEDGRLVPVQPVESLRRQDKPVLYARNGPAVLAFTPAVLERGQFYTGDVRAVEMTTAESVDIDHPEDLVIAECFLRHRHTAAE